MARVTIEDCLPFVDNMYELVHVATKRAKQRYSGDTPLVKCKNRVMVTSLREIAAGKVKPTWTKKSEEDELEDLNIPN